MKMFGFDYKKLSWKKVVLLILSVIILAFVLGTFVLPYISETNKWKVISAVPSPIRKIGRVLVRRVVDVPYLFQEFKQSSIPEYKLDIAQDDLDLLFTNLPNSKELYKNEYDVFVPGIFTFENKEYGVSVSLRGRSRDNWEWPKKSLEISFPADNLFGEEKIIYLYAPIVRNYLIDAFTNKQAENLGLLHAKGEFVNLDITGQQKAVYWKTESFGEHLLESNGLDPNANLYVEKVTVGDLYTNLFAWDKLTYSDKTEKEDRSDLKSLLDLLNNPSDELFFQNIFTILDEDNFYTWSVHNLAFYGQHQGWRSRMRLYHNPSTDKFMMIPWDVSIRDADKIAIDDDIFEQSTNPLSNRILSNPNYMQKRNERLWEYIKKTKEKNYELDWYDNLYETVKVDFYKDKLRRNSNKVFDSEVARFRNMIGRNFDRLYYFYNDSKIALDSYGIGRYRLSTKSLSPMYIDYVNLGSDRETQDLNLNIKVDGKNFSCEKAYLNIFECKDIEILPQVDYLQLPTPKHELVFQIDYYKAFRLLHKHSEIEVKGMTNKGLGVISFGVRNANTGEVEEVFAR